MLKWEESFKIGVEPIDEQHKELFSIANTFEEEVQKVGSVSEIDLSIFVSFFKEYALEHLGDEEELMENILYPLIDEHKGQHLEFIDKCIDLDMACLLGDIDIIRDVLDFLGQWIVDHIVISDAKIGQYIAINHLNPTLIRRD